MTLFVNPRRKPRRRLHIQDNLEIDLLGEAMQCQPEALPTALKAVDEAETAAEERTKDAAQ
jgi:hypothetical protein